MALDQIKASTLRSELMRLLAGSRPTDEILDLDRRQSPGPLTDDEWEDFVSTLLDRPGNRTFAVIGRSNRLLAMSRGRG